MSFNKISKALGDKIYHFAKFPQTGVSLRQMVKFGNYKYFILLQK
jgi:pyruvate dehydrogenase kinase 2/3/4